jgi:hypothetical protein
MPAETARASFAAGLLAFALAAHALYTTSFFGMNARAFSREGSYEDWRRRHALLVPVDQLARALDQALPREVAVSLTARLRADAVFAQRLAEGLYPRRLDAASARRLGLARGGVPVPAGAVRLFEQPDGSVFHLAGAPGTVSAQPAAVESLALDLPAFALGLMMIAGWGLPLALFAARERTPGLFVPACLLAGAVAISLAFSAATWLQLPMPRQALLLLAVCGCGAAWTRRPWARQDAARPFPPAADGVPRLQALLFAALVASLALRHALLPLSGWDGRSIWFFHAKQIALNGCIPLADLVNPSYAFSHPEYPLLLPAWLAVFAGGAPYNERIASVSIPLLFGTFVWLAWRLLSIRVGGAAAAALALAAFLGLQRNASLGYADAYLALLLLIQFLALSRRETTGIGWLAAAAASLLKPEGLVFASLATLIAFWAYAHLREPASRRLPWLAHAPGLAHLAFARAHGLSGDFPRLAWSAVAEAPWDRATTVLGALRDAFYAAPLLGEGAVLGSLAALVLARSALPRLDARVVAATLLLAAGIAAVVFAALLLTPRDVVWHAMRSADRLLLHPALLLAVTPFLALASDVSTGARAGSPRA